MKHSFLLRLAFCTLLLTNSAFADMQETAPAWLKSQVEIAEKLNPAPLISRNQFLYSSAIFGIQLSPDGTKLIYRVKEGSRDKKLNSIWLYKIKENSHEKLFTYRDIRNTGWSNDSKMLLLEAGNQMAVSDISKKQPPIIIGRINRTKHEKWLGMDDSQENAVLLKRWDENDESFYVERLTFSGESSEIYRTKDTFNWFEIDNQGKPSLMRIYNQAENHKGEQFIYDIANGNKKRIWQCEWDDGCHIIHYDRQQQTILMMTNRWSDKYQLVNVNLKGGHQVIHQDPKNVADLTTMQFTRQKAKWLPVLANYYDDVNRPEAIQPFAKPHANKLKELFKGSSYFVQIPSHLNVKEQQEYGHWLVSTHQHSVVRNYYLYELKSQTLTPILKEKTKTANSKRPIIEDKYLAPRFAVHYPARDGFMLQGYLTLPRGQNIKNSPLVVFPHGGPWSRDDAELNLHAIFLANRGYVVFQPNFRASTGLGKSLMAGTKKDFGYGTTHFDIMDSVYFLLNNGIGDKDKLGIAGHSFGGFSTLTALTFEPDVFKVGFAGAPPSHVGRSAKYFYRFKKKVFGEFKDHFMKELVVDWNDKEAYATTFEQSPEAHIDQLKTPLVMWAGHYDRRVFIADVKNYAIKAKSQNKPVTLFVDPLAKHSPESKMTVEAYMFLMEASLGHYLGGGIEPIKQDKDKSLYRFVKKHIALDNNSFLSNYLH